MSEETNPGPAPSKRIMRAMTALNVFVYRLSGGRLMNSIGGHDICMVTMKGAKSGKVRRIALLHMPWRDGLLFVGAQGGSDKHPGWYYNLIKYPEIAVQYKGKISSLTARLLGAQEKAEAWPVAVDYFPDVEIYRRRTTRNIPVFLCE